MNQPNILDAIDCVDLICSNLDQAEGILSALEISLSTNGANHPKLPFALTAAMGFIESSRGLVKGIARCEVEMESQGHI